MLVVVASENLEQLVLLAYLATVSRLAQLTQMVSSLPLSGLLELEPVEVTMLLVALMELPHSSPLLQEDR